MAIKAFSKNAVYSEENGKVKEFIIYSHT